MDNTQDDTECADICCDYGEPVGAPPTTQDDTLKPCPDMVERVARAISVPQHHTTWNLLTEVEQDLYRQQARYAITASGVSGQQRMVEDLRQLLRNTKIESSGLEITITVPNKGDRMNLVGHLANLRDRVI